MKQLSKLAAILAVVILAQAYGGTDQKPGATYNADANGDGVIDITDPVMMLHWLFADGPGPSEVFAQDGGSSALEARVAALEDALTSMAIPVDTIGRRIRSNERDIEDLEPRVAPLEGLLAGWTRFDREATERHPASTGVTIPGNVICRNVVAVGDRDDEAGAGNIYGRLHSCGFYNEGPQDGDGWDCEPFYDPYNEDWGPLKYLSSAIVEVGARVDALEGTP